MPAKVQISGRLRLGADRTATAVASAKGEPVKGERLELDSSVPGGTVMRRRSDFRPSVESRCRRRGSAQKPLS